MDVPGVEVGGVCCAHFADPQALGHPALVIVIHWEPKAFV